MVPGKEALHSWNGAEVVLNDLSAWPRFEILNIGGWKSTPALGDVNEGIPGRIGEYPRKAMRGGKTVVYTLRVKGRTLQEMRDGEALLDQVFGDEDEREMVVEAALPFRRTPHVIYTYRARPLTFDDPDEDAVGLNASPSAFQRTVVVGLRMSDPRFYKQAASTTSNAGLGGSPGGLALPAALPAGFGGAIPASPMTVDGGGAKNDSLVVTLNGPQTGTYLENVTLDRELRLNTLASGDTLVVDFQLRRMTLNGIVGRYYDPALSDWWDDGPALARGVNEIRYGGSDVSSTASLTWRQAFHG